MKSDSALGKVSAATPQPLTNESQQDDAELIEQLHQFARVCASMFLKLPAEDRARFSLTASA